MPEYHQTTVLQLCQALLVTCASCHGLALSTLRPSQSVHDLGRSLSRLPPSWSRSIVPWTEKQPQVPPLALPNLQLSLARRSEGSDPARP